MIKKKTEDAKGWLDLKRDNLRSTSLTITRNKRNKRKTRHQEVKSEHSTWTTTKNLKTSATRLTHFDLRSCVSWVFQQKCHIASSIWHLSNVRLYNAHIKHIVNMDTRQSIVYSKSNVNIHCVSAADNGS